jgi:replication factor C small subunit
MKKQHSLWIERFRPQTLDQYICSDELKQKFQSFIDNNDIPHLILAGAAGMGKSSLARLLVHNIDCDYLILNASDENGIDTIREKVKSFASSASFKPLKIIILEEASFLTGPAQEALKNIIEEFSDKTRFIFTANYLGKIVEPIQSRCEIYEFEP